MSPRPWSARHVITNERGSSLITLLGAALAIPITFLAVMSIVDQQNHQARQNEYGIAIIQLRQTLLSHLENNKAWTEILATTANASLACVRNGTDCSTVAAPNNMIPVIKDVSGAVVYDADGASPVGGQKGFDMNGLPCDGFSPTAGVGEPTCVFRFELTWKPDCTALASGCTGAPIEITGRVQRRGGILSPFNASAYDFKVSR